jgi:acetoin utilization protein AcuB
MSAAPHTIGAQQSLSAASRMMNQHKIRHLPVLDGGRLAGLLSQRDLELVQSLGGVDPDQVCVDEAMSPEPFTVEPDAPLEWVAATMADNKFGSAVVVEADRVVGVFTTIDALRALHDLLTQPRSNRRRSL